ncbi:uncharacterized protein [Montipora foliosa]|uniref:uncharacterized protein n=1 Tax=Montipora foliosa TaxID=591990 RepID=UPI0035F20ADD
MHLAITVLLIGVGFAFFVERTAQQAQIQRGQLQNFHYGNFKAFLNHLLNISNVLETVNVPDYIQCAFACLRKVECFSFNFAIAPGVTFKEHTCQLLPTSKYSNPTRFALSQHFHHYAIPSPCESFPCKHSDAACRPLYNENDYECVYPLTVTICEHDGPKEIKCDKGGKISVLSATYGRLDSATCPPPLIIDINCRASGTLTKVQQRCQYHTSCSLKASNDVFGDPCHGTKKYLLVRYRCDS